MEIGLSFALKVIRKENLYEPTERLAQLLLAYEINKTHNDLGFVQLKLFVNSSMANRKARKKIDETAYLNTD